MQRWTFGVTLVVITTAAIIFTLLPWLVALKDSPYVKLFVS